MADAGRPPDLTDFNPEFSSRLNAFKAALDKAGIGYSIASGYRAPEYQNQMYQNHLAKQAGQPLPYPGVEAPGVVAPAWRSFHNYGLAADFLATNPADYARIRAMAPQFGLSGIGASDPGHIQMAGTLADDINQYHLASWRPESQPAPAQGAIAYNAPVGQPSRVATATPGTPVNDFYHTAMIHESGGKNIPNAAGGWSAAGGYYQFTPPTWSSVRAAHPELNLPENVASASQDQQTAAYHAFVNQNVTALQGANLPINDKNVFMASFLGGGGATKFLTAMNQNPNASAADLFPAEAKANPTIFYANGKPRSLNDVYALQTGKFGTGNTTGYGPDATAVATAAPAAPAGATGTAAGAGGGTALGFKTQAGEDAFLKSAKGLEKAMGKGGDGQGQGGPPDVQPSQMVGPPSSAQNVSPLLAMIPMTYGQTINSLQNPLTWNSNPPGRPPPMPQPGAGVGGQSPMGTSLNSMAMMDPNMAQFPQVYPSGMGYMGMGYSYPGGGMPYG